MRRPYSTKRSKPAPAEFDQVFVEHGWAKCNLVFGKNPSVRWFSERGPARLRAMRDAYLAGVRTA